MRHVTLTVKEDLALGELGLVCDGVRLMEYPMVTRDAYLVAHDILEHQNGFKAIGSIGDEIQALGAMYYTRGWTGQLREHAMTHYNYEQGVAYDIAGMYEYFQRGVPFRHKPKRTCESAYEDIIDGVIDETHQLIRRAAQYEEPGYTKHANRYLTGARHLLREGLVKAHRRFRHRIRANNMFMTIVHAIPKWALEPEFEGQRFKLSYSERRAKFEELYPENY